MPGARFMPFSLNGETQYYNVLFLKSDIDKLKKLADKKQLTGAELVRRAVEQYILKNWED
tara:strand:- start:295 stop:474 length:180 start_codon:yes stop_codon:yes gene_type:complete